MWPAFANPQVQTRTQNALIVKAVTNGMFPAASYEISAEIPCYASGAQLVKKQTGPFSYDLSVTYSYQFAPGVMFCQSLRLETFTTSISSEFLPQINLLDAAAGVVLETQIQ